MKGMQAVVECAACGHLTKGTVLPRETQGDLFEDMGIIVSGLLDKDGTERTCPRCEASLIAPEAKIYVVYRVGRVA